MQAHILADEELDAVVGGIFDNKFHDANNLQTDKTAYGSGDTFGNSLLNIAIGVVPGTNGNPTL